MLSNILIIDNNKDSIEYLIEAVRNKPYNIDSVNSGEEAYNLLLENPEHYNAIVIGTDIQNIQGVRLLHKINSCSMLKTIPIIMEAHTGSLEEMETCIRAGLRYYIPKPIAKESIPKILETALRDESRYNDAIQSSMQYKALNSLISAHFRIQTLTEAQNVANILANECPNPRLAAVGISEMIINAIEHGNLGITYGEKTKLHETETWINEIQRRLQLLENQHKYVNIYFQKNVSNITIRIIDQGPGFDWLQYQDLDTKRVFDNHGRGIIMARNLAFESLIYHGNGNDVECIIPIK